MLDIKKSIAQGFGKGGLYDILKELQLFSAGIKGEVYFVENNAGDDGNLGKSWDDAFKTLTYALAVSHANIAATDFPGLQSLGGKHANESIKPSGATGRGRKGE